MKDTEDKAGISRSGSSKKIVSVECKGVLIKRLYFSIILKQVNSARL